MQPSRCQPAALTLALSLLLSAAAAAEPVTRVAAAPAAFADPRLDRVVLEMSLKPFHDLRPDAIRGVCAEAFRQWGSLIRHADSVAVLLWTADGSEILEYRGRRDDPIRWSMYIGHPNPRQPVPRDPEKKALHSGAYLYRDNPPTITYGDLAKIIASLKEVGQAVTGKPVRVDATFDPGGEFAYSPFKYEKHNEICLGGTMGAGSFVCCYATLNADRDSYAGFPDGIPQGTPLGTFLGRQSQHFLADLGFEYLWFSNGFGFGLETWKTTGPLFDGKTFSADKAADVRAKILDFWRLFRAECPRFPIETRGTNLATGIDLASNAVPLREIYSGGFGIEPPPNSPWAALNGDFGLELAGYMSRIAELPPGKGFPFRFYVHDPWWLNSPWLDRYDRQPHDIYLPLSIGRIDPRGQIQTPHSISILTIDDSYGRMPEKCPNEIIPHLLAALEHKPDRPGPLVWLYPFDEYHDQVFGPTPRLDESFFGDWFIRAAINDALPLNTVVSTRTFLAAGAPSNAALYGGSVLVTPVPAAGTPIEQALLAHLRLGGRVLLYGPTGRAGDQIRAALNLRAADPIAGPLDLSLSAAAFDELSQSPYPAKLQHRENMCAGGCAEILAHPNDKSTRLLATVSRGQQQRVAALWRTTPDGGAIAWARGTNSNAYTGGQLLTPDDRRQWFPGDLLMRALLPAFGFQISLEKRTPEQLSPVLAIARHDNAFYFSGYTPNTNVGVHLRLPEGAPIFSGTETTLTDDGCAVYHMPRAWHHECRVMLRQSGGGEISCVEFVYGEVGISRRLKLTGLRDATVTFFPDTARSTKPTMQANPKDPFLIGPFVECRSESTGPSPRLVAEHANGTLLISW